MRALAQIIHDEIEKVIGYKIGKLEFVWMPQGAFAYETLFSIQLNEALLTPLYQREGLSYNFIVRCVSLMAHEIFGHAQCIFDIEIPTKVKESLKYYPKDRHKREVLPLILQAAICGDTESVNVVRRFKSLSCILDLYNQVIKRVIQRVRANKSSCIV